MPEPAPVTMTVLPVKRPSVIFSTHSGVAAVGSDRLGVIRGRSAAAVSAPGAARSPAAARCTRSSTISCGERALAELHEALEREAADGLQHDGVLAGLREQVS